MLGLGAACRVPPQRATITLSPATTHQTITGWEATAFAGEPSPAFERYRDALFDAVVDDLGINRLRVEVRSGAESRQDHWSMYRRGEGSYAAWRAVRYSTVNDNGDPSAIDWSGFQFAELDWIVRNVVLPIKKRIEANGERLFINVNYVAFTGQIGPGLAYCHDDPEEYAEFVLATCQHLQHEFGIVPDAWEVILEPDNVEQWDGARVGRAMVAAARRLIASGFQPRFIAPSTTSMARAVDYFDQIARVPGALPHLSELSYHRYRGVTRGSLEAIAERAARHGIRTAQLEKIGATYEALHEDLEIGRNSAWAQYTLAGSGGDTGGSYYIVDLADPGAPVVRLGRRTRFLRQYFKFVRRDAVRIGAASTNAAFAPLAFVNANGRVVVVTRAATGGVLLVRGLVEGTYGIKYTTDEGYDVDLPDAEVAAVGTVETRMPAAGVITVYGK